MADNADRAQDKTERELADWLQSLTYWPRAATANECDECGDLIPSARQVAVPGCRYCIDCATRMEAQARHRRGLA